MGKSTSCEPATPTLGRDGRAQAQGEIIHTLINAALRQEPLLDALTAAVDSGSETAILEAARNLAANRRKDSPPPPKQRGRKPKELSSNL